MPKTNKELAVELAGEYINGFYSAGNAKPITAEALDQLLTFFYDAVKKLPEDQHL